MPSSRQLVDGPHDYATHLHETHRGCCQLLLLLLLLPLLVVPAPGTPQLPESKIKKASDG